MIPATKFEPVTAIAEYRAKKTRWDAFIEAFQQMSADEQREAIAKLLLTVDTESTLQADPPPKRRPKRPAQRTVPRTTRDWAAHPRIADIIKRSLAESDKALSAGQIYEACRAVRAAAKKSSVDSIISRLARSQEILAVGATDSGARTYGLPPH